MAMRAPLSASDYLALPYRVTLVRTDDGGRRAWLAEIDELPGCSAHAATAEEAVTRLQEAMEAWIGAALEGGRDVPLPRAQAGHSGRLLVRMPQTLHGELARVAEHEGVSLNQLIVGILASATGWRRGATADEGVGEGRTQVGEGSARELETGSRLTRIALIANVVVVLVAAAAAITVLVIALQGGW
jgi:predicted RNase H-like HicB family nuclease